MLTNKEQFDKIYGVIFVKNVLILEDDRKCNRLLADILSECREEMVLYQAYDEKEAMQLAMEHYMDLFIIDIMLHQEVEHDSSGLMFTKRIRENSWYEVTPVIFITSVASLELHTYREVSCYNYILKPLNPAKQKQLVCEVEKLLKGNRNTSEKYFYFKIDGIYYSVRIADLVMIRCEKRKLMVQTVEKSFYVAHLSLKRLKEELQRMGNRSIVQCCRGVLINQDYIENIDTVAKYLKLQYVDESIDIGDSKWLTEIRRVLRCD